MFRVIQRDIRNRGVGFRLLARFIQGRHRDLHIAARRPSGRTLLKAEHQQLRTHRELCQVSIPVGRVRGPSANSGVTLQFGWLRPQRPDSFGFLQLEPNATSAQEYTWFQWALRR